MNIKIKNQLELHVLFVKEVQEILAFFILKEIIGVLIQKNLVVTDLYDYKLRLAKKYGATHTYKIENEKVSNFKVLKQGFLDGFDNVIPCLLDGLINMKEIITHYLYIKPN